MALLCELRNLKGASTSYPAPVCVPARSRCRPRSSPPSQHNVQLAHVGRPSVAPIAAYAASVMGNMQSSDPMMAMMNSGVHTPGHLMTVHTEDQLNELLQQHPDQLTVVMCKSHSCRPCKMFLRKYMRLAEKFPEVVCLDIFGDESPATRKLMINWQVRVTPTFRLYRGAAVVDTLTGTNEKKLGRALLGHMYPDELQLHDAAEIAEFCDSSESDSEAAPAVAQQGAPVASAPSSSSSSSQAVAATL